MNRSRATPRLLIASTLLAVAVAPRLASADDANKGAAEAFFEQGRALVMVKKFDEACPKFAESLRLDPGIGTMLWLADCYENVGKSASAWALFKEAASTATLRQDARVALARRRADELEPKLPKLVVVPPPEGAVGLELRRDGVVLGGVELGVPVPVNPGAHVLTASAPGRRPWSASVTIADTPDTTSISVPVLPLAPERPGLVGDSPPPRSGGWGPRETVAVATAGAGLAAIGFGSYFGLHAKSTYDDWKAGGGTDAQENSSAFTDATVSTVLFCAGAAAVVGGAILYLTAPRASRSRMALLPVAAPRGGGLWLSSEF